MAACSLALERVRDGLACRRGRLREHDDLGRRRPQRHDPPVGGAPRDEHDRLAVGHGRRQRLPGVPLGGDEARDVEGVELGRHARVERRCLVRFGTRRREHAPLPVGDRREPERRIGLRSEPGRQLGAERVRVPVRGRRRRDEAVAPARPCIVGDGGRHREDLRQDAPHVGGHEATIELEARQRRRRRTERGLDAAERRPPREVGHDRSEERLHGRAHAALRSRDAA